MTSDLYQLFLSEVQKLKLSPEIILRPWPNLHPLTAEESQNPSIKGCDRWVLELRLHRPAAANAYSDAMVIDLNACLSLLRRWSRHIACLCLSAEGKHFCAGGDITLMREEKGMFAGTSIELRERYTQGIQDIIRRFEALSIPVIALIQGSAIGAGLDLACVCDIRLATKEARFAESFSKLGLIPGDGGSFLLQRVVGYSKAMELTLSARTIDATTAMHIGLVQSIHDDEETMRSAARDLALDIADQPVDATQACKELIKKGYRESLEQQLSSAASMQAILQRESSHLDLLRRQPKAKKPPETSGKHG